MDFGCPSLGNYHFPFGERTYPEASVMFSSNQMPSFESLSVSNTKLDTPESDCFVANDDASFSEQILNITTAQIESMVEPEREACPWGTA
jgi:hypothetical protein